MAKHKLPRGYDVAEGRFKEQAAARRTFVPRFFLKAGQEAKVVFLHDDGATVSEHTLPKVLPGGRRVFENVTSPHSFGKDRPDPLKAAGSRVSTVVYYCVVDLTQKYEDKNGKVFKSQKKLLGAKMDTFEAIRRQRAKLLSKAKETGNEKRMKAPLRYAMFTVVRGTSDKSPAAGGTFEFERYVKPDELLALMKKGTPTKPEDVTIDPLDLDTLLAPPSEDELEELAARFERQQANGGDEEAAPRASAKAKRSSDDDDELSSDGDDDAAVDSDDDTSDDDAEAETVDTDSDDEDEPVVKKSGKKPAAAKAGKAKAKKVEVDDDEDAESLFDTSDDDDTSSDESSDD